MKEQKDRLWEKPSILQKTAVEFGTRVMIVNKLMFIAAQNGVILNMYIFLLYQ